MVQLNDKLDKSFETIEDSSLSCIVTSQINESSINKNINNNIYNENRKILPNYKLPSMNYHDSLNNKNNDRNINSIIKNNLNDKNNIEENKKKEKILKEKETIKKNEIKKSKEIQKLKEEKIKEDNKKEEIKLKEEYTKDIKKFSEHETSTKSKDSKEHEVEEDENLLKNKKQNPNLNEKQQINLIKEDFSKEKIEDYINNYSSEMNIYDNLRLNKSMDYENINKDTLKFDIEFMCRCLGLALMRHIEQGKEKQHITELYFEKQNLKYSFFNSDFNKHISLLTDFFEINNSDINLGDSNKISILEKFCLENGDNDNDDIEIMKHIKKNGDEKIIQKNDIQEETFKSRKGFVDIENEIKFIGDFIYPRKKTKNYQDLSENTRKILSKDLSYIKEIDSEMNKTLNSNTMNNNSKTNISKSINNSKFNNNAINSENDKSKEQEDSKNNNENQNKIIDGDEKEEDYNYEDEFLNEYNIVDKKKIEEFNENNKEVGNIDLEDKNGSRENNLKSKENILSKKNLEEEIKNDKIEENLNDNKKKIAKEIDTYQINNINSVKKEDNKNEIETNYIIDIDNMSKFKEYLLKQFEIYDEDFLYFTMNIPVKRYMPPPDPQSIFEFCANIMILTKMEKETIILSLIYIERLIFNTGFIINSRNWRKILFISLIISSKIWDDDSLENFHYSQIFTHLKVGEINLLERTFLELINYKSFVKFSEYMKYYFSIKNLAFRYNFNGEKIVPVSVEKMMKIQEYAYQIQKKIRKKVSLNNSSHF